MIIITANRVSRTSVGLFSPCNIMVEMLITSMAVTASVRMSVPKGSPRRRATWSACRTTEITEPRTTLNNHTEMRISTVGFESPRIMTRPKNRHITLLNKLMPRNHSSRTIADSWSNLPFLIRLIEPKWMNYF